MLPAPFTATSSGILRLARDQNLLLLCWLAARRSSRDRGPAVKAQRAGIHGGIAQPPGPGCRMVRFTLLGTGAVNAPRYPPARLVVRYRRRQVMIDGGPSAEPTRRPAAWLVSDERSELRSCLVAPQVRPSHWSVR